jgi:Spy/CpxP family protein refolding chaperone
LATPLRAQSAPGFAWWKDPPLQKQLGLTVEQSSRLDLIFRAAFPHLREKKDELDAQDAELSRLIRADADESAIGRQSDAVELVRAELNKSRTLMLVHMRQILASDQRLKLNALVEERQQLRREKEARERPPH